MPERARSKRRSQTKTKMGGAQTWTKRDKSSGEFLAVKKSSKKKAAKKFKGVRREKVTVKKTKKIAKNKVAKKKR
jgi:hypothetical protein